MYLRLVVKYYLCNTCRGYAEIFPRVIVNFRELKIRFTTSKCFLFLKHRTLF